MDFELRKLQSSDTKSIAKYANNNNIAHNVRNIFPGSVKNFVLLSCNLSMFTADGI